MPEVTLDTSDPKLIRRLFEVLADTRDLHDSETVNQIVRTLAASPEPSEPPPGPYRDADGSVWLRLRAASPHPWLKTGSGLWCSWAEAKVAIVGELVPLFSVDELIPDPEKVAEIDRLMEEALTNGHLSVNDTGLDAGARAVLRVLRARTECSDD